MSGIKTRYGEPEPWKKVKEAIGRTKRSRTPGKRTSRSRKSDGRPPDTAKELLGKGHRKSRSQTLERPPPLRKQSKIVPHPYQYNPLFGWFEGILMHRHDREADFGRTYFQAQWIMFRQCTGDQQAGEHFQIKHVKSMCYFALTGDKRDIYGADVEKWFRQTIAINKNPEKRAACWRRIDHDGENSCDGTAHDLQLFLGIPVTLILEIPEPFCPSGQPNRWDFPTHIRPLTAAEAIQNGVIYDLVGRAFTTGSHFTTRFTPDDKTVYECDSMQNNGCAALIPNAKVSTHLAGDIHPSLGKRTYAALYHLRGGLRAQFFFTTHQISVAERLYPLRFSSAQKIARLGSATLAASWTLNAVTQYPGLLELLGQRKCQMTIVSGSLTWGKGPWLHPA
ncbi:hypothetical protein C8J57DRAFT_1236006 [Mycena rebaudengoi]|nr:hypothetical protein C8J57DRAFT_1236006 [Mycena rebaudengoi]